MEMVYNALLDLMELQKGEEVLNEASQGKLFFRVTMYGFTMELHFTIKEMDWRRCGVTLDIIEGETCDEDAGEDVRYLADMIRREFALLNSMLLIGTPFEVSYGNEA
jgi:hypothetical protein